MKNFVLILGFVCCAAVAAQDSSVIPFQGQLADQAGQPLSPTNAVTVVFRLYRVPVGGVAIWEESQPNISVIAGRFSVILGSRTELPGPTNFNATLYLGITIDDDDPATADVEMRPRQALVPVVSATYAKHAKDAETLNGFNWNDFLTSNNARTGLIPGNRLVPESISSSLMTSNSVTEPKLADSAVTIRSLAKAVIEQLVPPGTIAAFGGISPPPGWIACDGRDLSTSDPAYAALHTAIKFSWGGNGTSTFKVPDLRGRTSIGEGQGPGLSARSLGAVGGEESHILTQDQMPVHVHQYWDVFYAEHPAFNRWNLSTTPTPQQIGSPSGIDANAGDVGFQMQRETMPSGANQSFTKMQPFAVVTYMIKL
jgi:microcystin-dependent protein